MATQQAKSIGKTDYAPPPVQGDFYRIAAVLNDSERPLLKRVRDFTEGVVAPVIEDCWSRDAFPFEIVPKMAEDGGSRYRRGGLSGIRRRRRQLAICDTDSCWRRCCRGRSRG
jgi:glutaryl-CoA dehydrogenase